MPYHLMLSLISCLAGFSGGLTGTGGIIIAPIMIEFFGVPPHYAMATAQASFVLPSFMAVCMFARKGQMDWPIAIAMTLAGSVCTFASAAYLKPHMDGVWLNIFLALCIIISGAAMLKKASRGLARPLCPPWRAPIMMLVGACIGTFTGITGSGSNAIIVPILVFCGVEILAVLGVCQFFAVVTSAAGTVGNIMNLDLVPAEVGWLVAGQFIGMWLGVKLAQRMDTAILKYCVGIVCLLAGLFILGKAVYSL